MTANLISENWLTGSLNILSDVAGWHWIITYSGGKDSTSVTILAVETFRRWPHLAPQRLDIIYSDTLVEIPPMHEQALGFLDHVRRLAGENAWPIHVHQVTPPIEQRFWYLILGKGYPPPHRAFWWCTVRMKVKPVQSVIHQLQAQNGSVPTAILTGVRVGESQDRDRRIASARAKACIGQGECGQTLTYQGALAPIAHWKTCQVWDFLNLYAPLWGWPTSRLAEIYDQANTRFGCWGCTLVKQERALSGLIKRGYSNLAPLQAFRQKLLDFAADPTKRVPHPDGRPGGFTLQARKELLDDLLRIQTAAGIEVIRHDEVEAIYAYWGVGDGRIDA